MASEVPKKAKSSKRGWFSRSRRHVKRKREFRIARINKSRRRIDEISNNGSLGPLVKFMKANTERFKIITESVFEVPFDFLYHLLGSLHALVLIGSVGFLWILVWMLTEIVAREFKGKVGEAFDIVNAAIVLIDVLIDTYVLFVLGPIVEFVQVIACDLRIGTFSFKSMMPGVVKEVFCNDLPGFGNPLPIGLLVPKSRFISVFWTHLENMQSDCANFSTGLEELQATFKLIFSPYVCPVLQHVRPVPWLSDLFYYTIGWMSWAEGTKGSYENELARSITHHRRTQGFRGNASCEPPPDALWCYVFGLGFLIIEIILPLFVVMLIFTPLKRIVRAAIGVAFSVVYYSIGLISAFVERLLGSINWAGKRYAWIVVLVLSALVCSMVGLSLLGTQGIPFGCAVGVSVSAPVVVFRGGDFFGGPSRKLIVGSAALLVIITTVPIVILSVIRQEPIVQVGRNYVY